MTLPNLQALFAGVDRAAELVAAIDHSWTDTSDSAELYAILMAGPALSGQASIMDLAARHGWSDHTVERIFRARRAIADLRDSANVSPRREGSFVVPSDRSPIPFVVPDRPVSVADGIVVGYDGGGGEVRVPLGHIINVGVRGGGGTNLLRFILAWISRSVDGIVWAASEDAGLVLPFMFQDGKGGRTALDWVALDAKAADDMIAAATVLTLERKTVYGPEVVRGNAGHLPPTVDAPALFVMIDSVGNLTDVSRKVLYRLMRIGPAVNVFVIMRSQRGTVDFISSLVRKLVPNVIVGRVQHPDEYASLLQRSDLGNLGEDLRPGEFAVGGGGRPPRYLRVPLVWKQEIAQVGAAAAAEVRWPFLDPGVGESVSPAYRGRWQTDSVNRLREAWAAARNQVD